MVATSTPLTSNIPSTGASMLNYPYLAILILLTEIKQDIKKKDKGIFKVAERY